MTPGLIVAALLQYSASSAQNLASQCQLDCVRQEARCISAECSKLPGNCKVPIPPFERCAAIRKACIAEPCTAERLRRREADTLKSALTRPDKRRPR